MRTNVVKKPQTNTGKPFYYRGLIRCADCGLSITPERKKGAYAYYHCTQYKGKHNAEFVREEVLTDQFAEIFANLKVPDDIVEQITQTLNNVHEDKVVFHDKQHDTFQREQKRLTKMMDNLYMDKLQGSITESEYDKFYTQLRQQLTDTNARLQGLQEAEDNYYVTAKYILELAQGAEDMFESSEVEERRQLIKLVFQNLELKGKKLIFSVQKPLDLLLEANDCLRWRG